MNRDVTINSHTGVCTEPAAPAGTSGGQCRAHHSSGDGIACRKHPVLGAADSVAASCTWRPTATSHRRSASDLLDRGGLAARQARAKHTRSVRHVRKSAPDATHVQQIVPLADLTGP